MVETNGVQTSEPSVTIIVTPWQHFSQTRASLESIYAFTPPPFALIYVDGNSPPHVQRYLQAESSKRNFTLIRSDRYLTTSEAQNIAWAHVRTQYVACVENWVLVTPGWLGSLIRCAEETQAWVVEPLYCTGAVASPVIYSAAPELAIVEEQGERHLHETAPLAGKPLVDVRHSLKRASCGYAKSHCLLTRKDVLDRLGGFDEGFTSYQGHRDFSLDVHAAGGSLYFEPESVVVLCGPPPLAWSDLPLFLLRWSDAWLRPSIRHFARKWRLSEDDYVLQGGVRFRNVERRKMFRPMQSLAQRVLGWRGRRITDRLIDAFFQRVLEPTVIAHLERTRVRMAGAGSRSLSPTVFRRYKAMPKAAATIVVTPREQFSKAKVSLESILDCADSTVPLVYIDGNSPPAVARYLSERAAERGFKLIRTEHFLAANQARNLGLPHVRTKYVAFIDNDVSVTPGWLDKLIACAEETGAWAVGPLYLIDDPAKQIIHTAGAELRIIEEDGRRRLHEHHHFSYLPVARVSSQLVRQPIGLVEFHCMLVRTDVFDRLGPLDEQLISFLDHVDFCLDVADAGGSVYIEPAAVVTHLAPPPFAFSDLPCFLLRWSDAWMKPSIRRFAEKHRLDLGDEDFDAHRRFRDSHRMRLLGRARGALRRLAGARGLAIADRLVSRVIFDRFIENTVVRRLEQERTSNQLPALRRFSVRASNE